MQHLKFIFSNYIATCKRLSKENNLKNLKNMNFKKEFKSAVGNG